jgi:hypothetical protein
VTVLKQFLVVTAEGNSNLSGPPSSYNRLRRPDSVCARLGGILPIDPLLKVRDRIFADIGGHFRSVDRMILMLVSAISVAACRLALKRKFCRDVAARQRMATSPRTDEFCTIRPWPWARMT